VRRRVFDAAVFKVDLKDVLRTTGIEGTPVLLFLEERHLASDPGMTGCHPEQLGVQTNNTKAHASTHIRCHVSW
jgi:hypothetical protein